MSTKVFISYAHKDEDYKNELIEHMAVLKNSNIVSEWNDRKITPGKDWSDEISNNLESSTLILFLISSSFMNSEYCMGIEVKKSLEMHSKGLAQLIPIVIRPVEWSDSELSKLQGLPKGAQAVSSWNNNDEAWVNVISGIKSHMEEFQPVSKSVLKVIAPEPRPSNETKAWLSDTEIVLTHRKVNRINLQDVYVVPDVEHDSQTVLVDIKSAASLLKEKGHFIISGEDQQGKTSLLKYLFDELISQNFFPIYVDAAGIKKANAQAEITKLLKKQYDNLDFNTFKNSNKGVVLIDNLDEISLNNKYQNLFLEEINNITDITYITYHSSYNYIYGDTPSLNKHERVELLGLGNKKREELVQKWVSLGVEESISEVELYSQCNEFKSYLNIIIKKNIVPPKPVYILMLLQMFEANTQHNLELTSYGHCYQQLIYQSFDKAQINKQDFNKYLNVLTELSWLIFQSESNPNKSELEQFFIEYNKKYLAINKDSVIAKLVGHSILSETGCKTGFKYPYIYYFFVGKKIAESYSDSDETKNKVDDLLSKLHREDFANILIFITHHTKDSWVINEIKQVLNSLFKDQEQATLERTQLIFMESFMKEIPELIMEQREIQKERDKHNEHLDDIERSEEDEEEASEPLDVLANINKTFKGMEIAGQIIRNRHANLTRHEMEGLAKTGAFAGLRFLEYFIKISDSAKKEIIKLITKHLAEHPNLSDTEIEKQAENAYLHLTYGVISGITRKIASSIGSKEALEVYQEVENTVGTPAIRLIRQAIELQFNKSLSTDNIAECAKELKGNQVCLRILKEMVIQHTYMFPISYKEKQQLASLLNISIQKQHWMDHNKTAKG